MDPKEQDVSMTEKPMTSTTEAREARRRFLKAGAVGAPLILTFRSTSAWAVSAGCIIQEGDKNIPGSIIKVDENFQPILKDGVDPEDVKPNKWWDYYEAIFINKDAGDVADGQMDADSLRALVYNHNIGQTCLASINNGNTI